MCSGGYFSVSETPLLALAPLAIFIIADQLEILFFFIDKNSPAISFSTISWWKQGVKAKTTLFAADNSAEEDQTGPTGTAEFQLTQASLLGHPHGHSVEATSMGSKGQNLKQVLLSSMTCPEAI